MAQLAIGRTMDLTERSPQGRGSDTQPHFARLRLVLSGTMPVTGMQTSEQRFASR